MPELYRLTDWSADGSSANLGAYDDLDPEMQSIVMGLAQRIYDGEKITYDPDLLQATVKPYIDGITKGYGKSLADVDWNTPDAKTLQKLTENVFQFSASKDFHILSDMTAALKGSDGKMRSFDDFRAEVDKMNVKYNQNWLRTEYNQAVASSQCAARWTDFEKHSKSMPFLQYQAVMDGNTRAEHAALNGVIKRVDSDFWDKYYPPNGWGCRCEVIQLPGKNHKETPAETIKFCKVDDMWKVNVGKKGVVFPKGHPYFMGQCQRCNGTPKQLAINPQCAACVEGKKEYKSHIKSTQIKSELKGAGNWDVALKTDKEVSSLLMDCIRKIDFAKIENFILDNLKSLNIDNSQKFSLKILSKQVALIISGEPIKLVFHYIDDKGIITNKLDSIRILEKYQRKGLGTNITKFLIANAKMIGVSKVYFLADKAGGYAWASIANAKNRKSIMEITDERAIKIIDDYYDDSKENGHKKEEPFPMNLLLEKEWSESVLSKSSWIAEIFI